MRRLSIIASVLLLAIGSMGQGGSCGYWDGGTVGGVGGNNTLVDYFNTNYHINGNHSMDAFHSGTCTYVCPSGSCSPNTQCIATINVSDTPSLGDSGSVSSWTHVLKDSTAGSSASNNGQIASPASAASVTYMCPFGQCSMSITVTDIGVVTISTNSGNPNEIWSATDTYNGFCPSQRAYPQTPIIIDTANEGFQLTDLANGVVTDMVSPGHSVPLAWTKPGSHNAFLWLDGHLFGNSTPQPPSNDPNGFRALAVYDSNGDGVIDAKDPVFANLRLWIDANHDGVAQPDELFTLPSLGAYSISLHYVLGKYTDGNGNVFRYRGHLQKGAPGVDRTIYDVFLATE